MTLAAVMSAAAALTIMKLAGQYIPPAGALGILPMIIPQEALLIYPLEIFAGASVFMLTALCFRKRETE